MAECKYCPQCAEWKLSAAFYRAKASPDGLQSWCKHCQQARKRNPEVVRRAVRKWKGANREKVKAHHRLEMACRVGRIVRAERCEDCGAAGDIHAHHDDYSRPEDVRWLCRGCHVTAHQGVGRGV